MLIHHWEMVQKCQLNSVVVENSVQLCTLFDSFGYAEMFDFNRGSHVPAALLYRLLDLKTDGDIGGGWITKVTLDKHMPCFCHIFSLFISLLPYCKIT